MSICRQLPALFLLLSACATAPGGRLVSPDAIPMGGNLFVETGASGNQFLVLDGEITPETSFVFQALLDQADEAGGLVIAQSAGGNLLASHQIGRALARANMSTVVLVDCISACVNVFIAGREREIVADAHLGLHASDGGDEALKLDERYWALFGLEPVIRSGYVVPYDSIWIIDAEEALRLRLATRVIRLTE